MKQLVQSTFLPVVDYGDVVYMHTSASFLYAQCRLLLKILRIKMQSAFNFFATNVFEMDDSISDEQRLLWMTVDKSCCKCVSI